MEEPKYLSWGTQIPGFEKILKINLHLPEKIEIVYIKKGNSIQRTDQEALISVISHDSQHP